MTGSRRTMAFALVVLMVLPAVSGCLGFGRDSVVVAASAPKASDGMTIFVATYPKVIGAFDPNSAEYVIYYGDRLIYPPGGRGASFPVADRSGSVFIPYNLFVVGNGEYDVLVRFGGEEVRARVNVQKWVEYVFVRPFDQNGPSIMVQAALGSATGARPEDRILSKGDLVLSIHYRGLDGKLDRTIGSVTATTRHDQVSTSVDIPRARFNQGPGYYSVEPVFHNLEARDNVQVPADPTMGNRFPPANWVYIAN